MLLRKTLPPCLLAVNVATWELLLYVIQIEYLLKYTWSRQATARAGNALGQVGVGSGLVVTLGSMAVGAAAYPQIAACMVGGAAIGTLCYMDSDV